MTRPLLAAGAVVLGLLTAVSPSEAKLSHTTAYLVALKDAQAEAGELGGVGSYSTPRCKRVFRRRIDCRVWAEGREFVVDQSGSFYEHKRCEWTVVALESRVYPYVRAYRRGSKCQTWISDSPVGPS